MEIAPNILGTAVAVGWTFIGYPVILSDSQLKLSNFCHLQNYILVIKQWKSIRVVNSKSHMMVWQVSALRSVSSLCRSSLSPISSILESWSIIHMYRTPFLHYYYI